MIFNHESLDIFSVLLTKLNFFFNKKVDKKNLDYYYLKNIKIQINLNKSNDKFSRCCYCSKFLKYLCQWLTLEKKRASNSDKINWSGTFICYLVLIKIFKVPSVSYFCSTEKLIKIQNILIREISYLKILTSKNLFNSCQKF